MSARKTRRMSMAAAVSAASIVGLLTLSASAGTSPSPDGARVYFVNLSDGQSVTSPFKVVFGLKGMGVAPAGVDNEVFKHIGHHHLFIDTSMTDEIAENGIPFDDSHKHFGKGQTETSLDLPPGKYRLRLVFGDPYHVPHKPVVASEEITIRVR